MANYTKSSVLAININLLKTQNRAYQWKLSFNSGRAKQVQVVILLRNTAHAPLYLNKATVKIHTCTEASLSSARSLSFKKHNNGKVNKATKAVPAGKYWSPGLPEDVPLHRPQDVSLSSYLTVQGTSRSDDQWTS